MNIGNLLNQFMGSNQTSAATSSSSSGLSKVTSALPGGIAGGAAAGGIVALLAGSKKARKFAGKAATYGGAAVLGGIAYSAFSNWRKSNTMGDLPAVTNDELDAPTERSFASAAVATEEFQLKLIQAMICAANADGHIDRLEQRRIFEAVDKLKLDAPTKALVFESLSRPPAIEALVIGVDSLEQRSELYLASCLTVDAGQADAQDYLLRLEQALQLPPGLANHLSTQVQDVPVQAA